jgi:hypothetical protein
MKLYLYGADLPHNFGPLHFLDATDTLVPAFFSLKVVGDAQAEKDFTHSNRIKQSAFFK